MKHDDGGSGIGVKRQPEVVRDTLQKTALVW
jgi:hypothetical protein